MNNRPQVGLSLHLPSAKAKQDFANHPEKVLRNSGIEIKNKAIISDLKKAAKELKADMKNADKAQKNHGNRLSLNG